MGVGEAGAGDWLYLFGIQITAENQRAGSPTCS